MKKIILFNGLICLSILAFAQESVQKSRFPLKVTVFTESIGIPNFRNFFRRPNVGVRIGTELYYKKAPGHQLFQTVNLGFYHHRNLHTAWFVSSEFGYRKTINKVFADVTAGVGYLVLNSALPRYKMSGSEYVRASNTFGRIMPTVGLGAGCQFPTVSVFTRYEIFGEMPFGYGGIPALPHKALHIGAKFKLD